MIDIVALGKGEARKKSSIGTKGSKGGFGTVAERVYRFDEHWNVVEIPLTYDQADRLLVKLRDEAHRFSNYYRKQQMRVKEESLKRKV